MRSVEDMLLQLILHIIALHLVIRLHLTVLHHVAPHRAAPCCTHHHNVGPHDYAVYIILLHLACHAVHACCYPMCLCSHATTVVPLCLAVPCCCPMCLSSTMYLVVPCILAALCTLLSHLLCCTSVLVALLSHAS